MGQKPTAVFQMLQWALYGCLNGVHPCAENDCPTRVDEREKERL